MEGEVSTVALSLHKSDGGERTRVRHQRSRVLSIGSMGTSVRKTLAQAACADRARCSGDLLPPSPPAEKATALQNQGAFASLAWIASGRLDIEREVLIESLGEALGIARRQLLDQIEPQLKKINALELKLAELTGAVDILRGVQPPPPAKFPNVKAWTEDVVYHEGDVVAFAGGTYQATKDTARAPGSRDWLCLAGAGAGFTIRGTYDGNEEYKQFDVVMLNGSSFVALEDNPGPCPGDDWHLLASRGSRGHRGDSGARGIMGLRGERGEAAPTIRDWEIDRSRYLAIPIMSNGSTGPALELRALFEQYFAETAK